MSIYDPNKRPLELLEQTKDETVQQIIVSGLLTDGAHHKQWFLEVVAAKLGVSTDAGPEYAYEMGTPP